LAPWCTDNAATATKMSPARVISFTQFSATPWWYADAQEGSRSVVVCDILSAQFVPTVQYNLSSRSDLIFDI
jgi:hypothetical protein